MKHEIGLWNLVGKMMIQSPVITFANKLMAEPHASILVNPEPALGKLNKTGIY